MATLQSNGIELFYEITGQGEPLLFIHGLGSCTRDWDFQVAEFSKDYRVVTFDLRGHGQSARPPGPYDMEMFAADAAGLLRALGIESAHVVGVSLGGGVAFQLAITFPPLLRSLVIVNSAPDATVRTFRQRLMVTTRLAMVRLLGFRRVGQALAKRLFPEPELADVRAAFLSRFVRNDKRSYVAAIRAFIGWSVLSEIGRIGCPVLVVAADHDYTPIALKEAYVARIPGAQLAVIPDSRHAVPVERPQRFNAALRAFLEQHSKRTAPVEP